MPRAGRGETRARVARTYEYEAVMTIGRSAQRAAFEADEGRLQIAGDGELLLANQAAAKILGYEDAEALLRSSPTLRSLHADPDRYAEFVDRITHASSATGFESEFFDAHGGSIWVSLSAWGLNNVEGHLVGYEVMFFDVTARRVIEAAARAVSSSVDPTESMTALAEALRSAVPFVRLTLTAIRGELAETIFRFGPLADYAPLHEGGSDQDDAAQTEAVATRNIVVVQNARATGSGYDSLLAEAGVLSYAIVPLVSQGEVFATLEVGFAESDAATSPVVEILTSVAGAISQGVRNSLLFDDQRSAAEELRRLDQIKNEFIGTVSHDLRSPMAAVAGFAELLNTRWEKMSEDHKRRSVTLLHRTAKQLQRFVDDVLQVAHLESGKFRYDIRPLDPASAIEDAVTSMDAHRDRFEIRVPESLPKIKADSARTWQVLTNLVSNALKFSPEDKPVEITAEAGEGEVVVSVRDEGAGISESDLPLVFERFSQGRRDLEGQGAGLGLYISKRMVEEQGGRLWVESTPGVGTTFSFSMPSA